MTASGFDHLVVAARDLDGLADFYRRLGFQVGARNRHDWGTLNHIVQFDGTFLELIGLEEGFSCPGPTEAAYPFAAFLEEFLGKRDGLAMIVLPSTDADRHHAAWARQGIKTHRLDFARSGVDADGRPTQVAFSLAFAASPDLPEAGFFVCQQHYPQNFWFKNRQVHPNTAVSVSHVVMQAAADLRQRAAGFLSAYIGAELAESDRLRSAWVLEGGARLEMIDAELARTRYGAALEGLSGDLDGRFIASHIGCRDLQAAHACLSEGGIEPMVGDSRLVIPAAAAYGQVLVFESA